MEALNSLLEPEDIQAMPDSASDDPVQAFCEGLDSLCKRPEADRQSDILNMRLRLGKTIAQVTAEQFEAVVRIEFPGQMTHIVCIGEDDQVRHKQFGADAFPDPVMAGIPLISRAQTEAREAGTDMLDYCEYMTRRSGTPVEARIIWGLFSKLSRAEAV